MGVLTCTQMQAELARRVTQLPVGAASLSEAAINRAIKEVNSLGSYSFQLATSSTLSVTTTGVVATPVDFDPGKAHQLIDTVSNQAIRLIPPTDIWASQGYNTISDTGYDTYYIQVGSGTAHNFVMFPAQATTHTVAIYYHKITVDITGAGVSNLPRDFDDLIIDLAESEERRIYDVGDAWPQLRERTIKKIETLLDGYRTETIQAGKQSEAAELVTEKTKLGRG